jgi:DNA-binding transcriptional LysR family regulator
MLEDWELLRVLLETSRAGGLRKAQNVLGLTQPTIGKKIDQLERQVGTKVLIRTKAGVSLTPAGEALCRSALEMERITQRALDNVNPTAAKSIGRVRVAMTDGMAGYWLPRRLRRFHRENPHITLDVQCIPAEMEVDLSRREADITVMYRPPTDPDVVVIQQSALELAPLCTKTFAEDWGVPTSIEDVLNFPVIAHPMHYLKQGTMRPWAEMLERHTMVIYRTASSVVLGHIAKMGIGVSLQPVGILDREDYVMMLDLDGFRTHLPFFLVSHKAVKDVPAVRTVITYLRDSLFRDDGLGSPAKRT